MAWSGFGFAPKRLSKSEAEPIRLELGAHVETVDGSRPEPVSEIDVALDRRFELDLAGIPGCTFGIQIETSIPVPQRCRASIVGSGQATERIDFPEQMPIHLSGHVLVIKQKNHQMTGWAEFSAPISGSLLFPIDFEPSHEERFGSQLRIHVPTVANGNGSLLSLQILFAPWGRRGAPSSPVFSAHCDDGKLEAFFKGAFPSGRRIQETQIRTCAPTG